MAEAAFRQPLEIVSILARPMAQGCRGLLNFRYAQRGERRSPGAAPPDKARYALAAHDPRSQAAWVAALTGGKLSLLASRFAPNGCWPPPRQCSRAGGMRDPTREAERLLAIRLHYTTNTNLEDQGITPPPWSAVCLRLPGAGFTIRAVPDR